MLPKIKSNKVKNSLCVLAILLSFALYVMSFEPCGIAEFAYVFAVPAILAARILYKKTEDYSKKDEAYLRELKKFGLAPDESSEAEKELDKKTGRKIWLISTLIFSVLAWIVMLAWIRFVYPPAGYAAVILLPMIVAVPFIYPWFAILPRILPSLSEGMLSRAIKLSGLASFWVLLEWIRSWIFTGFPWSLLAHSQWQRAASIQIAEYTGVWGISFVLIFFNIAAAEYIYRLYESNVWRFKGDASKKIPFSRISPEFYIALLLAVSSFWIYIIKVPQKINEETAFRAGMVQTDFAGILKWSDALSHQNLEVVKRLTLGLKEANVDVVLWPEAATPPRHPVIGSIGMRDWIEKLSAAMRRPIVMGNMAYFEADNVSQNGAFAVSPETGLSEKFYAKTKLVPFGEYVPSWCSWIGKVVPVGNMKRGEKYQTLEIKIKNKTYKVGPMICYEDIFTDIGRKMSLEGANILFVCTNDSWYGREGGAWQHAAHSALQAVATRLPLMRSSNNGLSTVFDQYGRMRPCTDLRNPDGTTWDAKTPSPAPEMVILNEEGKDIDSRSLKVKRPSPLVNDKGSIYFRGAGFADVTFYKNFKEIKTFYVKYGDWFISICAILFIWAISKIILEKNSKKKLEDIS